MIVLLAWDGDRSDVLNPWNSSNKFKNIPFVIINYDIRSSGTLKLVDKATGIQSLGVVFDKKSLVLVII